MFSWSSQFHSHSFLSLCELELILWQFLLLQKAVFNSYPYMNWKWNWKGGNIQIFSSEIILAWENGSQGHIFGQILNSNFLKSLRHSALSVTLTPRKTTKVLFGLFSCVFLPFCTFVPSASDRKLQSLQWKKPEFKAIVLQRWIQFTFLTKSFP